MSEKEMFERVAEESGYSVRLRELTGFTFQQAYNAIDIQDDPKTASEAIKMMIISVMGLEMARLEEAKVVSPSDIPLIRKVERCSTTIIYYRQVFGNLIDNESTADIKEVNAYLPTLAGHVKTAIDDYSVVVSNKDILDDLKRLVRIMAKLIDEYNEDHNPKITTWEYAQKEWGALPTAKKNEINKDWEDRIRKDGTDMKSLKPITKAEILD